MDFERLLAAGFVHAPYDGDSYKCDLGDEGNGAVYLEDNGNGTFTVSVYRPAGNQTFFQSGLGIDQACQVALTQALRQGSFPA